MTTKEVLVANLVSMFALLALAASIPAAQFVASGLASMVRIEAAASRAAEASLAPDVELTHVAFATAVVPGSSLR